MFQSSLFDTSPQVFTVSEINGYIRQKLEADVTLQDLWLEGEISNWKQAASGHIYFTLKDNQAAIRCVIWRSQAARLIYMPQTDGEAVLVHGRVSVYEAGGNYQFYVDDIEPAGQGALYAEFERLKQTLAAEGLFDEELKRPLPDFPQRIGIVTSPDGAALRDILNVLRRRYPVAQVILSPTLVQGDTAPPQIIAAVEAIVNLHPPVDTIIVARGGGSLEDLWAFNDEAVARTIAACPVPVISGVGHETDFTITDFVADVRAPTPSAAAELATPDRREIEQYLYSYQFALADAATQITANLRGKLQNQQWALERLSPQTVVNNYRQNLDTLLGRSHRSVRHTLQLQQERINNLSAQLETLNPQSTLSRGYAIVQKGDAVVTQVGQVSLGDDITVQVSDGEFGAKVKKSE
jgi:exodeoxyribonuclease VII large subunit